MYTVYRNGKLYALTPHLRIMDGALQQLQIVVGEKTQEWVDVEQIAPETASEGGGDVIEGEVVDPYPPEEKPSSPSISGVSQELHEKRVKAIEGAKSLKECAVIRAKVVEAHRKGDMDDELADKYLTMLDTVELTMEEVI